MSDVRIQLRRDLANNWQGVNPILADGEMGIETDTHKFKFGDGHTAWNELPYGATDAVDIPTALSQFENDVGFITLTDVETAGFTKNVGTVTMVNGYLPGEDGNVILPASGGTVTSVNNVEPDENGNVTLDCVDSTTLFDITGDLDMLYTADKSTLVAAINELVERVAKLEKDESES